MIIFIEEMPILEIESADITNVRRTKDRSIIINQNKFSDDKMRLIATILVVAFSSAATSQDFGGHALFVKTPDADSGKKNAKGLSTLNPP